MVDSKNDVLSMVFDGFLSETCEQNNAFSAVFEDNGRVAYAYLIFNDEIVSDVWLYNHGDTPAEPEWNDASKAPFKNPREFVLETTIPPVTKASDIEFESKFDRRGDVSALVIFLHGTKCAILKPGVKPGWSALASRDGPLAKPLSVWPPGKT